MTLQMLTNSASQQVVSKCPRPVSNVSSRTWLGYQADICNALLVGHETQHREDDETREDTRATVGRRED